MKNDSILHTIVKQNQNVQPLDHVVDRIESEDTLGRNPNIPSIQPVNIPTKLVPTNDYRVPIRGKPKPIPLKDRYHKRRPPPKPPVKKKPQFPFGSLPNPFLPRPGGKARSASLGESEEQRLWERDEFTVIWRESRVLLSEETSLRRGQVLPSKGF